MCPWLKVIHRWWLGGVWDNSSSSWKYLQLIHEIRDLVLSLKTELVHVPRTQNGLADKLAKWGVELPNIVRSNVIPEFPK